MNLKTKNRPIAVCDCETDPFVYNRIPEPFIWGFYDGDRYLEFTDTSKFVNFIKTSHYIIYAHNGGKFDFHFLLSDIEPFTQLRVINNRYVSIPFGNSELRDSYSIIPTPLSAYKKMNFDYSKLEKCNRVKYMDEIREYLKSDCIYLFEYVKKFVDHYGKQLTLASSAMKEFLRIHKIKSSLLKSTQQHYDRFYPWYFGGRVQALRKGIFDESVNVYDINSAYPYAMTHKHPIGTDFDASEHHGEFRGTDFYIIKGISHGLCPTRTIPLTFPNDSEKREWNLTGYELIAGLQTKTLDIDKVVVRYRFKQEIDFSDFVEYYYEQKKKSPKDSTEYIFAKLMLNSLYGKFAANPAKYFDTMIIPAEYIAKTESIYGWEYGGLINENIAIVRRDIPEHKRNYYNIATAASITGFVRSMLWSAMCKSHSPFYCDTDSLITSDVLPTSINLGDWKLEMIADKLIIISPKLYGVRDIKTHQWKIASKGIEINAQNLMSLAKGKRYVYHRDAPTFSVFRETQFVERIIGPLARA